MFQFYKKLGLKKSGLSAGGKFNGPAVKTNLKEENLQLQMTSKLSISESQSILAEMETMKNINSKQDTNILTEQLGEGMSRIHRLELELKRLRQENEDLKLDKFHADANKMLALETENKKLSLTIQQLQVCVTYLDTICINV